MIFHQKSYQKPYLLPTNMKIGKTFDNVFPIFAFVEVTGLEPATAWSQTRNATNCATPRFFAGAKVHIFRDLCKFFRNYFMIPCSTKIFFRAMTERSTCSSVCVAINA